MARLRGRARRGERLRSGIPRGHWKTTTLVAGLRLTGLMAPFVLDGPMNRSVFLAYVTQVLAPELKPGDVVILDNLPAHKGSRVREAIEAAGASVLYLPPYSPDFSPSRTRSPSSKPCSAKPPSEQSRVSGPPSAACLTPSRQPNALTTSKPQDTIRIKPKML